MKRMLMLAAFAAVFFGMFAVWPVQAQHTGTVISAQPSPYLVDFFARQSKRADLRVKVAHSGLDAAFSSWLSVEHPDAYLRAVRQSRTSAAVPHMKSVMRAAKLSGSCCVMAAGCCSMCPSCCTQSSCSKGCCNLSACSMRPNCCKSA